MQVNYNVGVSRQPGYPSRTRRERFAKLEETLDFGGVVA